MVRWLPNEMFIWLKTGWVASGGCLCLTCCICPQFWRPTEFPTKRNSTVQAQSFYSNPATQIFTHLHVFCGYESSTLPSLPNKHTKIWCILACWVNCVSYLTHCTFKKEKKKSACAWCFLNIPLWCHKGHRPCFSLWDEFKITKECGRLILLWFYILHTLPVKDLDTLSEFEFASLSFFWLLKLHFFDWCIKTTYEHTWDYGGQQ